MAVLLYSRLYKMSTYIFPKIKVSVRSLAAGPAPATDSTQSNGNPEFKDISLLNYSGKKCVVKGAADEDKYHRDIEKLSKANIVGFDMMLKDYGGHLLPTVVQLLSDEVSVLWRLRKQDFETKVVTTWISPLLTDILMRKDIMKVGHGICQDAVKLLMAYHLEVYCFHDVFLLSTHLDGLKQLSLDGLVRLFLHKRLLKEQALTDWGKPLLAYNQMEYSANSAFAALTMYKIITGKMQKSKHPCPPPITRTWVLLKPFEQDMVLQKPSLGNDGQHSHPESLNERKNSWSKDNSASPVAPSPLNKKGNAVYTCEVYEKKTFHRWFYPDESSSNGDNNNRSHSSHKITVPVQD